MPSDSSEIDNSIESKYGEFKIQKTIPKKSKKSKEIMLSLAGRNERFLTLMEQLFNYTFEGNYDPSDFDKIKNIANELLQIYDANVTHEYSLEGFHNYIHNSLLSLGCNNYSLVAVMTDLYEAVEGKIITNIEEYDEKYRIISAMTDELADERFKIFMKLRNDDAREDFIKELQ